jgi:subtilase family serine protease
MKALSLLLLLTSGVMSAAQAGKTTTRPVAAHAIVPASTLTAHHVRPLLWGTGQAVAAIDTTHKVASWVNVDEMRKLYGLDTLPGQGEGVTIAIVDAYDSPTAEADLNTFSAAYGLPLCTTGNGCFTKVNQNGSSDLASLPSFDSGWSQEINLDTQWVHAIAPQAKILLVEASSNLDGDLFTGIAYAAAHASVVSLSWSGGEYSAQSADWDWAFARQATDVTFLASTGDVGSMIGYPSTSSKVIAVGGTTVAFDTTKAYYPVRFPASESGWNNSGGGCSAYTASLTFQKPLVPKVCTKRAVPDLSLDGDPNSGVLVAYLGRWYLIGGTSLSCPMAAGMVGIANGMRLAANKAVLGNTLQHLYDNSPYPNYYRDITTGTSGLWPWTWNAGPGFDFITGAGAPKANALVPYLVSLP